MFFYNNNLLKIKGIIIFVGIMLIFCGTIFSQKEILYHAEAQLPNFPKTLRPVKKAADSSALAASLEDMADAYHRAGYLAFSIDSVRENDNDFSVFCYLGPYMGNAQIRVSGDLPALQIPFAAQYAKSGSLPYANYSEMSEKIVQYYENHGHPFCSVSIQNIDFQSDTIGTLQIIPGPTIVYDSIIVKGNAKVRPSFLRPYLAWRKRKKYVERAVSQIPSRIQNLPYAQETRESGVEFVDSSAFLYLFLDKQRVNQFDGYVGLVPVNPTTGKVTVNGEVNLNLQNLFTIGEKISLRWQAPERYSQYLHIVADFPYLFSTPFGISGAFTLDKKDTTYLNMNYLVALQYSFFGNDNIRTYFDYTSSTMLVERAEYLGMVDSSSTDFRKARYGLQVNFNHTDDIRQPWKGFIIQLDLAAGRRTLLPSTQTTLANTEATGLKSNNYTIKGNISGFVPMGKRWGWAVQFQGATQFGSALLYNELFRFGGTHTLQGFDEQSLFASTYIIGETEFRFRFAKLSYIKLFFNAAWYERNIVHNYFNDWPLGFGIGATFNTKAGDLYISYALGKQDGSPISFKSGKIHFGIEVRF